MMNHTALKADFKLIAREPILVLFSLLPILIFIVFKTVILFVFPFIYDVSGFDFSKYNGYILIIALLLAPGMLGTVTGFLMIDERDSRIYELMSITPTGYAGYITNRLLIPFLGGIIYTFIGYYFLNIYEVSLPMLIYISILGGLEGVLMGLLLFKLADDKVKGLTYSKGLSGLMVFAFADLLRIEWFTILSAFSPFYWISKLVHNPNGVVSIMMAAVIHGGWLWIVFRIPDRE